MKIKELIEEFKRFDPEIIVCGQSETSTWEIFPYELVAEANWPKSGIPGDTIMILGYKH